MCQTYSQEDMTHKNKKIIAIWDSAILLNFIELFENNFQLLQAIENQRRQKAKDVGECDNQNPLHGFDHAIVQSLFCLLYRNTLRIWIFFALNYVLMVSNLDYTHIEFKFESHNDWNLYHLVTYATFWCHFYNITGNPIFITTCMVVNPHDWHLW